MSFVDPFLRNLGHAEDVSLSVMSVRVCAREMERVEVGHQRQSGKSSRASRSGVRKKGHGSVMRGMLQAQ